MSYALTPVEERGGLLLKRDDLFMPFGAGVNGGKLRQCLELVRQARPRGVVTACSVHSPQAPIAAAVAKSLGIPCLVMYGGTNAGRLKELPMPRLAMSYGARLAIAARTGRHNVLYSKARAVDEERGWLCVEYGFNLESHPGAIYGAVAEQVANVPKGLERVCVTCGSGITASGLLLGFAKHGNAPKELHLYATAPSREQRLKAANKCGARLVFHDLFHERGFLYEREEPLSYCGVPLHPNYEAKAMRRFLAEGIEKHGTLFWIVGAKPKRR